MRIKIGDTLAYKDDDASMLHGPGIVMVITDTEYTILWARRGSKKYRRSILDQKLADVFRRESDLTDLPKEKRLLLGASKSGVSFNENYDRAKVTLLCEALRDSGERNAEQVADGLAGEIFKGRIAVRAATKDVLWRLAEMCGAQKTGGARATAQKISQELFFGYVIQKSDFKQT